MVDVTKRDGKPRKKKDTHRITRKQQQAIARYVAILQEEMRLCGWRIQIDRSDPPHRAVYASIFIYKESHEADLHVDRNTFVSSTREKQRLVLVHELCHLIHNDVDVVTGLVCEPKAPGKRGLAMASQAYNTAMEIAVDDYAYLIARSLPLPDEGWLD